MFSNPKNNIRQLGLASGMSVADFGSGSGHYVMAISELVGEKGRVYAIDIQKSLLQRIKNIAEKENRWNIDTLWGDIEHLNGTKLADNSIDSAILSNTLFQVEDKNSVISEIYRTLKPRGKLLLVDWADSFGGMGPRPEDVVTESVARQMVVDGGFKFVNRFEAGAHHYGMIFQKI